MGTIRTYLLPNSHFNLTVLGGIAVDENPPKKVVNKSPRDLPINPFKGVWSRLIEEPGVWTVLYANPSGNYQGIFHRLHSCLDLLPQGPLGYSRGAKPPCGTL